MFKVSCFVGAILLACTSVWGASIYVYVDQNGNKLLTDHPRNNLQGYTFVKKYGVDDYFGLADRPSNSSSGAYRSLTPIASRYDDLIISKANEFGLEPALLKAIIHIESSFDSQAVSSKGATGLMQLMPATAKKYGVSSRTDPTESIEGGGRYMKDLLAQFDFDLELALAAYNAGENAVVKYNGVPPYPETQHYVDNVKTLMNKYRKNLWGA